MNLASRLQAAIREHHPRIAFIGDTMTDRWLHGTVSYCQDECTKFVQESVVETPGGAANAHRSISEWGVTSVKYGFPHNERPVKTRYVVGGKVVWRADNDGPRPADHYYDWIRDMALEACQYTDAVLMSDYDKGFLIAPFMFAVATMCKARGVPCVVDCKRAPDAYPAGCVMKGNSEWAHRHEVNLLTDSLVITYGSAPPSVGGRIDVYGLPPVQCVNHIGAGDCFAAHLVLALACKFTIREAAALAHSAGRVYVQHSHGRPPTPTEITADMDGANLRAPVHC